MHACAVPPVPQRRGTEREFRSARNQRYYSKKTLNQGRPQPTKHQTSRNHKRYNPDAVDRRERRMKSKLRASEAEIQELRKRLRTVKEVNAAEKILSEAEHQANLEAVLEELEALRKKAREHDAESKAPLDFRRPDGSYSSEFTLMCAKVLNSGVAASRASDVIEIVIEFATKRKLASKPSERTHGRIIRVIFPLPVAVVKYCAVC